MGTDLLIRVILITSALVFYSIGVWSEKIAVKLKGWHLIFFWLGLSTDTAGTTLMATLSAGFAWNIHGVTGIIAIVLMFIHTIWATIVLIRKDEKMITNFHKFSIFM